ncbi:type I secretion system permease/ATPase [Halomonas sp. EGI 63088]|uniref:Type I secretion system permease/ATPase n=1 Tax=Halomonas flagellata TaxID=2920385 RepID=A0ABS9RYT6_9GAMM|nr:type I secretion system permease/ATPase [Halomonas flagellata]MCH4564984.1 type I secretion system permease/ATPase [Halomonas flagellata]
MADPHSNDELWKVLGTCRKSFLMVGFFSMFINLLMLVPAIYMLQVYDRVITTYSKETLLLLTLIAVFLFLVMGGLELVRSRILVRVGNRLETLLGERLYAAMIKKSLTVPGLPSVQPLNDLTSIRQFLTGNGLFAFFDAPWIPLYLGVLFLFHMWLGVFATVAGLLLLALAIANEISTRRLLSAATSENIQSRDLTSSNLRNAEVLQAMGMVPQVMQRWASRHHDALCYQSAASDRAGILINLSKMLRIMFQSLILGVGAYLVLQREVSPGMMIAGSIIMGRALAPIDQMIGGWKGVVGARGAYRRIADLLAKIPPDVDSMALPPPKGHVSVEAVAAAAPGERQPAIAGIHFTVQPGEQVGIVGPSAAGKSTLARALLGIWPALAGTVRLDGVDITQWNRQEVGAYLGYLPQDIELFHGSISENIARFGEIDAAQVVEAARKAGVHEMILRLPQGYDTQIDGNGTLSGGQRQRIGLARALYGRPVLVMLDEPNAYLDAEGDKALTACLQQLKREGTTLFVISHRSAILQGVDKLLVLKEGRMDQWGTACEVLGQITRPATGVKLNGKGVGVNGRLSPLSPSVNEAATQRGGGEEPS